VNIRLGSVIAQRITPIKVQNISKIKINIAGFWRHISIRDFQLPESSQNINNNILTTAIAETEITPASGNKIAMRRAAIKKNDVNDGFSFAKKNLFMLKVIQ
jgi:hypothetical protein